jgi:hypothetical protein
MAVAAVVVTATIYPAAAGAGGRSPRTGAVPPVAVSLRGSIVLFAGHRMTVVTHSGQDHAPVLAPNGRGVAFWRGRYVPLHVTRRRILVARRDADGVWHVAQFSTRPASAEGLQQTLAWAPGGNALAWYDGATVQYRRIGKPQRTILRLGSGMPTYQTLALAFSRDGGAIAATLPPVGTGLPRNLRVAVRPLSASGQRTITITFRPGVLIGPNHRGSIPVGDDFAYTTSQLAPPGHTLEIETIAAPGAGRQLTGVFLAPDSGGRAWLIQGNGHGLHGIPPFGYGMNGATHFGVAPDDRYIATDPTGGFYAAGEIGPRHVSAPVPAGCVLAQWTWLADSVHLAYVTDCVVPGSSPLRLRLTLSTVSIFGGAPVVLYRTVAGDPNAIDLAPSYRCVACG